MQLLLADHAQNPLPAKNYNVAPTTNITVAIEQTDPDTAEVTRQLTTARWGLVPHWAKNIGTKPLINARSETVVDKPSFRTAVKRCRVVVPCDGWYEWRTPKNSSTKEAWFLHSDSPLLMAGIGSWWRPPASKTPADDQSAAPEVLFSAAILTEAATGFVEMIHHRSPVFLTQAAVGDWLSPQELAADEITQLLSSWQPPLIEGYRVSPAVGNVRNNGPELLEPLATDTPLF